VCSSDQKWSINAMIKYFVDKEEYVKCAILQGIINGLENNKQTDRHGRVEPN